MARASKGGHIVSRRRFLGGLGWSPVLFLPSPLRASLLAPTPVGPEAILAPAPEYAELRLQPRYPSKSPLEEVLRLVVPGLDEFPAEKYALEISRILDQWSEALRASPPAPARISSSLSASLAACSMVPIMEKAVTTSGSIHVFKRCFASDLSLDLAHFQENWKAYLASFGLIKTAEFQIVEINEANSQPATLSVI